MKPVPKIVPEYIIDGKGNKKSVIIPFKAYKELLEDIEDLAVVAERREESVVSHENVVRELRENGYLPD